MAFAGCEWCMDRKLLLIVLAMFLIGALSAAYTAPRVNAATVRHFNLYGNFLLGWNGTNPGPTIVVEQGDNVTMTLWSEDVGHIFSVSYNNVTSVQAGDPESPTFGSTHIVWSFVATTTVGTYLYYCVIHTTAMEGWFKVVPTGSIPEFPVVFVLPLFMVLSLLAVVMFKRKRPA